MRPGIFRTTDSKAQTPKLRCTPTHHDGHQPKDPAPTQTLRRKRANDGSNRGSEHASERIEGHRGPAPLRRHHVADAAAPVRDGTRAHAAGQEAEAHQHGQARAEGARGREDDEQATAGVVDGQPAVHLRQRGEEQGPDGEAEHVNGDGERARLGVGGVELVEDLRDRRRGDGGG